MPLLEARDGFPDEGMIHCNLACYTAKQGRIDEAKGILSRAIQLDPVFGELTLDNEDLVGIW